MKKIAFTIADDANLPLAKQMINTLRKFHSEEELPVHIVTGEELSGHLRDDPHFFYRATPVIAQKLFAQGYDLVIKMDADQLVLGDISYIWDQTSYDVGTVLNINRVDPITYGHISTCTIDPSKYFNAGLVAMRNREFVNHWSDLCFSEHFGRLQFREQDLLNIICHYGKYKVICFDHYDELNDYYAWHGLVSKGETPRAILKGNDVVIPRGDDNYPDRDTILKIWHTAGGSNEVKVNFRTAFSEELIKYIEGLIKQ